MPGRRRSRKGRQIRIVRDPALRRALFVLAGVSLVFLVAVGNMIAVAEGPPEVRPATAPAASWQAGTGTVESRGQEQWTFAVDPMGRRVVELEFAVPFRIDVAHESGDTQLLGNVVVWVDGERLRSVTQHVRAQPGDAERAWAERGDAGDRIGRVVIEREPDGGPFPLLLTWDWTYSSASGATRYEARVGPVDVEAVALPGLPGCTGATCARALVVVAVVAQGVAVAWFLRVKDVPAAERGGERTDKKK